MRHEKRTTWNIENSKKRKAFFKEIGGSIAIHEPLRFANNICGKYAGIRQFDDRTKSVILGCYDIADYDKENTNYRDMPRQVDIGRESYRIELRKVEKQESVAKNGLVM